MRKRRFYVVVMVVGVLVGVLVAGAFRSREPEYGGKRLSQWVLKIGWVYLGSHRWTQGPSSPEAEKEATDAIRHIGTNSLPFLLTWIRYERSPLKANFYELANRWLRPINSSWRLRDKADLRASGAASAICQLGPGAEAAIGELSRIMNDPYAEYGPTRAAYALSGLGDLALPAFMAGVTNKHGRVRESIVCYIGDLGAQGRPAVSALQKLLEDPDTRVREAATNAIRKIDPQALEKARGQ